MYLSHWRLVEVLGNSRVPIAVVCSKACDDDGTDRFVWSCTIDGVVRSQGMPTARLAIEAGIMDIVICKVADESS